MAELPKELPRSVPLIHPRRDTGYGVPRVERIDILPLITTAR